MLMLSQFVVDCLSELNFRTDNARYSADIYLRNIGENAERKEDAYVLTTLSGVLSMSYNEENDSYLPQIIMSDGRRTFAMEDLDDSGIEVLKEALPYLEPSWIKAQLSDILWIKTNDHAYAQMAVSANLVLFNESYDPEHWIPCYQAIRRAFRIALKLGNKSNDFTTVIQKIDSTIRELNGTDQSLLSLKLISTIVNYASIENLNHYLMLSQKLFAQAKEGSGTNELLVKFCFDVQSDLLKRLNRKNDIRSLKLELAEYYETLAKDMRDQPYHAIQLLQNAYNLYDFKQDRERIFALRNNLETFQQAGLRTMASVPIEYDVSPIRDQISALFQGLSRQEMIIEYGRVALIYNMEDVHRGVLEEQRKNFFLALASKHIVDENGHLVKVIPPLDLCEPEKNAELFREHMLAYVTDRRNLGESISLGFAYSHIREQGDICLNDLNFLIDRNAIIPEDRKEIVKQGLLLGLNGELYVAMHILLPQTENIIRELAKMCGDTVTYLKEDGTEEFKPLSQLLIGDNLRESYDENFLFTLETLLDERGGPNLRNENAHGFLSPVKGSGGAALCFLSLLIRFLSLYSQGAIEIMEKLVQR